MAAPMLRIFSTFGFLGLLLAATSAQALAVPFLGWGYSVGYAVGAVAGSEAHREGHAWSWVFDPPAYALRGQITLQYDPSQVTIVPAQSGFIGHFSDNPASAPPVNPSGEYPPIDTTNLPGPRPGMISNLNVGPDTVTLTWDISANPPLLSEEHHNFYVLTVNTAQSLSGWTIENTATGTAFELGNFNDQSQTYMICDAGAGEYNCGLTSDPGVGFGLTAIARLPALENWMLGLLAFALLAGATGELVRRQRSQRRGSAT